MARSGTHNEVHGGGGRSDHMRIEAWYRDIIFIWLLLGLPPILVGIGFAGGNPFDNFDFSQFSPLGLILWVIFGAIMFAPIWLAPFGLKLKRSEEPNQPD